LKVLRLQPTRKSTRPLHANWRTTPKPPDETFTERRAEVARKLTILLLS
jgi:hypothetical protein